MSTLDALEQAGLRFVVRNHQPKGDDLSTRTTP